MEEYYISGIICSMCLIIIIIVTIMLFIQSNRMRKDVKGDIDDIVKQINNSQYYAYSFDKLQESNIRKTDQNMNTVLKKFVQHERDIMHVTDEIKADVDKMKKESLTAASIGSKSVPVVKADKLEVNGNIMMPSNGAGVGWAGGSSKVFDNGDLNIVTGKKLNITANLGVNVSTGGGGIELTVNGSGVVLGNYSEFTQVDKSVDKSGGWGIEAANPAWDPDFRGKRVGLAYSGAENDADASAFFMEFLVPTGMKQAYVVHLPWENCRYFDVMGRIGNDVVFIKRVNSWHPQVRTLAGNKGSWEVGGHHAGATAVSVAGVNRFERIRIQGRVGRIHLMGVGWTKEEGRGMETGYLSWDNVYSKPNLKQNGSTLTVTGGIVQGESHADWTGANFKRRDGSWTHFDWVGDKKNYIRGNTVFDGVIQANKPIVQGIGEAHDDWTGANFKRRDGSWTHFDWVGDGKNYIRGNTNVDGQLCVQGTCITGNDLKKVLALK